jgi:hypothetical protein
MSRYVRSEARSQDYEKRLLPLVISALSVMPSEWNSLAPTEGIFVKFYICVFFKNPSRKFRFHCNRTRAEEGLHVKTSVYLLQYPTQFFLE